MSDHSWVHIQIVTNIALRLARLLFRRGIEPSVVKDHGMTERDAEVVIAAGSLLHCLGWRSTAPTTRRYSLFLAADKLPALLAGAYDEPERTLIAAEAMHAIISHRTKGKPFTVEGAIVRVADALDMAQGRARVPVRGRPRPTSTRCRPTRSRTSRSRRPRQGGARRDRDVQLARGSSRSTKDWAPSCAGRSWRSTSRSSRASTPSTKSASYRSFGSKSVLTSGADPEKVCIWGGHPDSPRREINELQARGCCAAVVSLALAASASADTNVVVSPAGLGPWQSVVSDTHGNFVTDTDATVSWGVNPPGAPRVPAR